MKKMREKQMPIYVPEEIHAAMKIEAAMRREGIAEYANICIAIGRGVCFSQSKKQKKAK